MSNTPCWCGTQTPCATHPADYERDHEGAGCWCLESDVSSYECVRAAHVPCRWCNDEGVVHDMAGDIIGPCDCDPVQA